MTEGTTETKPVSITRTYQATITVEWNGELAEQGPAEQLQRIKNWLSTNDGTVVEVQEI